MATKIKGLQMWCRRMTEDYAYVDIANFTSSWRDGMAFCALIHRFRPDLIDYDSLSPENVFENCKLAFEVAEQELDIPAFLEAEDMAKLKAPDKLSVITYVSQYYNVLSPLPQLGGPGVRCKVSNRTVAGTKRPTDSDSHQAPTAKRAPVMQTKENTIPEKEKGMAASIGDICGICQNRVYLLERHMEGGKLYHRSCFRHSELSPTNKVYTRSPFLSPSLKSETPTFTYPTTNSGTSGLTGVENKGKDFSHRATNDAKTVSEASSISKKSEGAGTKHQLDDLAKDSTKKSKLHSKFSLDEEKSKKAAIVERLQNLKAKYSINKSSEVSSALPLSGKEARKFERKREEMMTSQKPAEEPVKIARRSMPISLQQNDKLAVATSKSDLVLSVSTTATSSTPTSSSARLTARSTASSTSVSATVSTAKTSNVSVPTKLDTQSVLPKNKHTSVRNSEKSVQDKLDTGALKKSALSNPQTVIFGRSIIDSNEPSKHAAPVAKPRSGTPRSVDKSTTESAVPTKPAPRTSAEQGNKDITPKPAPRKSMLETLEKTPATEQKMFPGNKKPTLHSYPNVDELDSSRPSTASNPPPLPISAPPPLPASHPVGEIIPSLAERGVRKSSNELASQETKSSLHHKIHTEDDKSVSSAKISLDLQPKSGSGITTTHNITEIKKFDKSSAENTSSDAHVKSQTTDSTENVSRIKLSPVPIDRRWSSPISAQGNIMTVSTASAKTENESKVFPGLLTSLTVVRDNTSSSPVSSDSIVPPISSSAVSSSSPEIDLIQASPRISPDIILTPSSKIPVTETHPFSKPALEITNLSNSESDRTSSPSTAEIITTDVNPMRLEKTLDSDPSELESSKKNVDINSIENSGHRVSSSNVVNEKLDINYESRHILECVTEDTDDKKFEKEDRTNDCEQNILHPPQPAKRSFSSDESRSQNTVSSRNDDLKISSSSIKKVSFEEKEVKNEPASIANSLDASKGETKCENTPQKPPRILKMAKLASLEKPSNFHKDTESNSSPEGVTQPESQPQSAAVAVPDTTTKELPQWKKDIEERKKKLREEIAKSESESVKVKHLREKGLIRAPINVDILAQKGSVSIIQNASLERESRNDNELHNIDNIKTSSAPPSEDHDSVHNLKDGSDKTVELLVSADKEPEDSREETDTSGVLPVITADVSSYQTQNSLPCQRPEEEKKDLLQISKASREHIINPDDGIYHQDKSLDNHNKNLNNQDNSLENQGKSVHKDSCLENQYNSLNNQDTSLGKEEKNETHNKATSDYLTKSKTVKLKDSELEFVVSKAKLKSVEVDIDISSVDESQVDKIDQNCDRQVEDVSYEGLKNSLKRVSKTEDVCHDLVEITSSDDFCRTSETSDISAQSVLPKPLPNKNGNNNVTAKSDPSHLSDMQHIQSITEHALSSESDSSEESKNTESDDERKQNISNESIHSESNHISDTKYYEKFNVKENAPLDTIDLRAPGETKFNESEDEGVRRISVLSQEKLVLQTRNRDMDEDKDKHTSPKMKRKITVLGRNKAEVKSPPLSPLPMKKIEVTTKFNFEESSEFEISLTDSTAKLTIQDKSVPPPRPPPRRPHHKEEVPPLQISAIELQQQLLDIDSQLTDLELRGRDLEESIRNENTLDEEDDGLINDWFRIVCERNDLVRKEADLVYISRQQDLEDEQEHIESQLRYLMSKPYDCKSAKENQEEAYLIKRKLELVEQRNKIVDSMDEDRIRYETEDKNIKMMREKGLWRNSTGTLSSVKEKKLSKSVFYT